MRLDLGVLEELRKELERSQDMTSRPVVAAICKLSKTELQALGKFGMCDRKATLDQVWQLHYLFEGTGLWTRDEFEKALSSLKSKGILKEAESGRITFEDDYFDKLYTKYFAAEQKIRVDIQSFSLDVALMFAMVELIGSFPVTNAKFGVNSWSDIASVAGRLADPSWDGDIFASGPGDADDLFFQMLAFRKKHEIPALFVSIKIPAASMVGVLTPDEVSDEPEIEKARRNLSTLKARAESLGGSVVIDVRTLPVGSGTELSRKLKCTENEALKTHVVERLMSEAASDYLEDRLDDAVLKTEIAVASGTPSTCKAATNIGYILMQTGRLGEAKNYLKLASELPTEDLGLRALAMHDDCILHMKLAQFREARDRLEAATKVASGIEADKFDFACVIVPEVVEGELTFVEKKDPDFMTVLRSTRNILDACNLDVDGLEGAV